MKMDNSFRNSGYRIDRSYTKASKENFQSQKLEPPTWKDFSRILGYFKPYWLLMLFVLLCIGINSALSVIPPLLVRSIVDNALPHHNLKLLAFLSVASIGMTALAGLIRVLINFLNTKVGFDIIHDIRTQMFRHIQKLPLKFFTKVSTGEVMSRVNNDINGIESIVIGTFTSVLTDILQITFILITMINMNWKMTLLGLGIIPFFILPTRIMGKLRWKISMERQEKMGRLSSFMHERLGVNGILLAKLFGMQEVDANQFSKDSRELKALQIKVNQAGRWFKMAVSTTTSIGPQLIYWYGGFLLTQGTMTMGTIIAFVTYLNRLYNPITGVANIHVSITSSTALFTRIFEYLDMEEEETLTEGMNELPAINGHIRYNNVTFSYEPGQPILKNIDFEVLPGQMTALVGPSGAGKTTIIHLLPRLYDPDEGSIEFDGIDLKTVTMSSIRRQIGIVSQDIYLFNSTIKDNLLYAKPDATDEEIVDACKAAYIHDLIMSLPDQYDTVVGQRGTRLSGGEKQRLAIARVILSDPKILILDEATSSLDSQSEAYIQKAIGPILKQKTSLVIAHRLSTILSANQILVIEDGCIKERGTHNQLLSIGGLYKKLYEEQYRTLEEEIDENIGEVG